MSKINTLSEQQCEILDRLFWLDENDEEDAAEIDKLKKDLLKVRDSAYGTLEFLAGLLLESKAILEAREDVKRRAERRRKTAESAVERLTTVCEHIMKRFEIQKISLDECDLRLQMSPGALEYMPGLDFTTLPEDCFKVEAKPIAAAIMARLKDGEEIPGISIVKRETLRVG